MPKPKKSPAKSESVTKEFLIDQLGTLKTHLEAKIESAQRDFREHIHSLGEGLNKKIDGVAEGLNKRMDGLEMGLHLTQLAVREVKNDTIRIEKRVNEVEQNLSEKIDRVADKVEHHDTDITRLKAAVLPA